MTWPANARADLPLKDARHVFLIEMDAAPDSLVRALGPFALHGAIVAGLDLRRGEDWLELRIETCGLARDLAARLGRKLEALPIVRTVGLGWTSP